MKKGLPVLLLTVLFILISAVCVCADDPANLIVSNSDFTTTDVNSTYIDCEVPIADGQDVDLNQGMKNIARVSLPSTGKPHSFRIKVPTKCLNKDRESVFRVKANATDSLSASMPVKITIRYKAKKIQSINSDSIVKLTYPGKRKIIRANVSSSEKLLFSTDNPKVVKVDKTGTLIPVGTGKANVTISTKENSSYESATKVVAVSVEKSEGYLVTYHASIDDKEDQIHEQLFDSGAATMLDANTFNNEGREFFGWATEDGGLVKYTDAEEVCDIAEDGESIDLYAVWAGDGANAAVAWAIKTAGDDSFNYGYKPATACPGCYFCGTNKRNKPSGYEKTYVCMTFVHAAYAHGAEDPEMLADCEAGRFTVSLNDWNFGHWSCWEKVGRCSNLSVNDLEPGDVIIWWADDDASGHASIYIGDNNIVDAGHEGWDAGSIAVRNGYGERYLRSGARMDSRSYVMRYVKPSK